MASRTRPKVFLSDDPTVPEDVLLPLASAPGKKRPEDQPVTEPEEEFEDDSPAKQDEADEDFEQQDDEDNSNQPSHPADQIGYLPDSPVGPAGGDPPSTPAAAATPRSPLSSAPPHPKGSVPSPLGVTARLTTYRSRIAVVEAWRYPGSLTQAPGFIDRSWAAYVNEDELSGKPAGPALRVPVPRSAASPSPPDGVKICRVGDYVVLQKVTLAENIEPEQTLDVWPKEDFEKLFIPETHTDPLAQLTDDPIKVGQLADLAKAVA